MLDAGTQDFWDLDFATRFVQGGLPYVRGLKKPEAVAAFRALVGVVQLIPNAPGLLQEDRALAGRRVDGLDKAGGADHVRQALQDQRGIRPFAYTAALRASGVPQAPPPRRGQQPAHSYVPPVSLPWASLRRLAGADKQQQEVAAADLLRDSREELDTQEGTQYDSLLFPALGTLAEGGAEGDGADGEDGDDEEEVSGPNDTSNPVLKSTVAVLLILEEALWLYLN